MLAMNQWQTWISLFSSNISYSMQNFSLCPSLSKISQAKPNCDEFKQSLGDTDQLQVSK